MCFSSRREQTRLAGKLITLIGEHLDLQREECAELEIAVVEAVNNAIIHACKDDPGQRLTLEISCQSDQIRITLTDHGAGFDHSPNPSCPVIEDGSIDLLPTGGFGLYLIHQVMDEVDYRSEMGTNTLVMKKYLSSRRNT